MATQQSLSRTVVKNASANLVRLAGSGIVALLLPPFLVRMLPTETYSVWALLLQLTLYVTLLDFGIQTAVARFVAHAQELHDPEQRDSSVSTAAVLLIVAALVAFCFIAALAWQLPRVFNGIPTRLEHGARIALLLMGGSFALGLPFSVIHSVFIGLQRNEIPAAIVVVNRFAMAALIVGVVFRHWGLASMGLAVAIANVASYGGSYVAWRLFAPHIRIQLSLVSTACAKNIGGYSLALGAWFAGMLMISGLDLAIVAKFDYPATAYYAVAATLIGFVAQTQGAIFASLLPASAVLSARGDAHKLGEVLVTSTRYGMFILLGMALPLIVAGRFILRLWVGPEYAMHSTSILQVLVVANVVRLCALPYATLLLGTNQQRKVIMSPLAEGVTNLSASVLGAYFLGAIGVAIGTLIGSFVGVGLHLLHNMPRTSDIAFSRFEFVKQGLLRPLACSLPFCALFLVGVNGTITSPTAVVLFSLVAISGTGFLFWNYGLVRSDRRRLRHVFHFSRATDASAKSLKPANG